jgi:predicted nucleotidyltransferase component of viral defense system
LNPKKKYKSANAFKMAIQDKLRAISQDTTVSVSRLSRQVAYTHLLARLFKENNVPWVLKGGHALELRLQQSRATKDVDLALKEATFFAGDAAERLTAIKEELIKKARIDLNDFFEFLISGPKMELENAPDGGARFAVEAKIDGKIFSTFDLDIGIGDTWIEPHDLLELKNHLDFTGFVTPKIKTVSVEQHFAEKIHAYTVPRDGRSNSRVKDLVDLYLLVKEDLMDKKLLKAALKKTFERRKTHVVPGDLVAPPKDWEGPWDKFEVGILIGEAFHVVKLYYLNV